MERRRAGSLVITCKYFHISDDGLSQTVFNDNDLDKLTGSPGADWFFAKLVADNGGVRGVLDAISCSSAGVNSVPLAIF